MGTPDFALPSFEVTRQRCDLVLVVTQPDRPAGRGRHCRPPAVKVAAEEAGIEVVQPEASVTRELKTRLAALEPDVIVVTAFGKFLGRAILDLPPQGCINVHASLLPRYRGASPVLWAVKNGDAETGVSVQRMVAEMDAGDVLGVRRTPIGPDETTGELAQRLAGLGAEALEQVLGELEADNAEAQPQDHSLATFAPMIRKEDGLIDWTRPAGAVHDLVRAMNPWPRASTGCDEGRLIVHRTRLAEAEGRFGSPGEVVQADKDGLYVACGSGKVEILEAQREGRKLCCAVDLVSGRAVAPCQILGLRG